MKTHRQQKEYVYFLGKNHIVTRICKFTRYYQRESVYNSILRNYLLFRYYLKVYYCVIFLAIIFVLSMLSLNLFSDFALLIYCKQLLYLKILNLLEQGILFSKNYFQPLFLGFQSIRILNNILKIKINS